MSASELSTFTITSTSAPLIANSDQMSAESKKISSYVRRFLTKSPYTLSGKDNADGSANFTVKWTRWNPEAEDWTDETAKIVRTPYMGPRSARKASPARTWLRENGYAAQVGQRGALSSELWAAYNRLESLTEVA